MKNAYYKIGAWISTSLLFLVPSAAFAAPTPQAPAKGLKAGQTELGKIGTAIGSETNKSLPELIGNLIGVFLGVLGIIFVILTVYAGYLYMTAAGDEKKVTKAKETLGRAVIGLVIIVAAYAISDFVIGAIVTSTT